MRIPDCDFALIGGSGTLSIDMPENLGLDYVTTDCEEFCLETPYGAGGPFKIFTIESPRGDKKVISCRMHNWQGGVSRGRCSQQAFWVFQQAGVKKILSEGGVGAVNYLLKTRDMVIPHDYVDFSLRKDISLTDNYLLIMRDPFCGDLRKVIKEQTEKSWAGRVFDLGVYANTEGRHFESPSEISYMKRAGADIVGQSVCPEVYLAREIGACYAGMYMVVNYAEGVVLPWRHEELADIFYNESISLGKIMIDILRNLDISQNCSCPALRKETLLTKIYSERKNDDG